MSHYVIVYDRAAGRLVNIEEYGEDELPRALKARFDREIAARRSAGDVEVALLGAVSRDALQRTHGRYFRSPSELGAGR